jgi:hypothetical protein
MALKILPLAHSTTLLDCGWYTEAKTGLVPIKLQKSLKSWLSNCLPLSTMSSDGTPKRQTMFCLEEFLGGLRCYRGDCHGLNPLCEIFNGDEGELEVTLSCRQWSNDVQPPALRWPCVCSELGELRRVA